MHDGIPCQMGRSPLAFGFKGINGAHVHIIPSAGCSCIDLVHYPSLDARARCGEIAGGEVGIAGGEGLG